MVLAYNMLHYKEKKMLLGGVSRSVMEYCESKEQRGVYKILASLGFWVFLETLLVTIVQYYSASFLNWPFGDLVGTGANYFGLVYFAPLLVVVLCVLLKIDPLAQLDLITPAYPLALFFSKIGCQFAGCCRGIEWEHGFYNPVSELVEFPAPLLEAGVALLLFIFLLCCKNKFKKGTVFPIYLMVYSGIRFFTEFLRWEPSVFLGLKTYQILCLVGVLVGALEYLIARKYDANARVQKKSKKQRRVHS